MRPTESKVASILAVLCAVGLASCQKAFHEETERYFFVASNVELPYWKEARAGFEDAGRVLGVKVEFTGPSTYSPEEQLEAFRKAVAARPSGILVSPARAEMFTKEIDAAIEAGIPVLCVDSDAPNSKRILFIGTDNYGAGMESGRRMAEALKGQGNVVVITVPGQLNLDERERGVKEVFQRYPNLKIIRTVDDKGDPRLANDAVSEMLEAGQKVDGILALEASGGPGAAEALHRLDRRGQAVIIAMDRNPETLDWIERGYITATIAQKVYTMSFYGLRFLDDLHHNIVHEFKDWRTAPASPLPTRVDTGTAVIDSGNLAAFRAAEAERRQAF
jgi:ribose transport system substrate-binding protein